MWFTETAWPPIIGAVSLGLIFGMVWFETQRPRYLAAVGLCTVLGVGSWLIDRGIVTERERAEQSLLDVVSAFERQDIEAVLDSVSSRSPELREIARLALERVTASGLRVTDVSTDMSAEDTRARMHFRVNGVASLNGRNVGHQPTRWIGRWEREKDRWRLIEVQQLDTLSGEPIRDARRYLGR
jgi:hypothetical protein